MSSDPFPVVDGTALPLELRSLLRPGEELPDGGRLPRYFYEVDSWSRACATKLTAHFTLSELMTVDCREASRLLHGFPHYVPCTISVLARYLEEFRTRVDGPVFVSVNGGYRSPAHAFSRRISPHLWATAANIYRIGDTFLNDERSITRYGDTARGIGQELHVKSWGHAAHETDDHLHLDLGRLTLEPS